MYVCVYVCMYICMYIYVYIYIYICVCVCVLHNRRVVAAYTKRLVRARARTLRTVLTWGLRTKRASRWPILFPAKDAHPQHQVCAPVHAIRRQCMYVESHSCMRVCACVPRGPCHDTDTTDTCAISQSKKCHKNTLEFLHTDACMFVWRYASVLRIDVCIYVRMYGATHRSLDSFHKGLCALI